MRQNRVDAIDALRGFALFGVVVSNVAVFAGATETSPIDQSAGWGMAYLVTGRFLGLFALLFGVSFALFLRPRSGGPEVSSGRYFRRMAVLFGIGVVHRVFFGVDILMPYALLGLALLLLRRVPDRALLLAAVLGLALPELWRFVAQWLHYVPPPPLISRADRMRLTAEGPYLELVWLRARMLPRWWYLFLSQDTAYLTPMALGFWAARKKIFENLADRKRLFAISSVVGLTLALVGFLTQDAMRPALSSGSRWAFGIVWTGTTFVQAAGYGAGVLWLWLSSNAMRRSLAQLVPAGRMPLTNYLSVSIIATVAISATRMYGRLGLTTALGLGCVLYVCQLAWSAWWLRRHRTGPAEWLWRALAADSRP